MTLELIQKASSIIDLVGKGELAAPVTVQEPLNFMRAVVWDLDDTLVLQPGT